MQSTERKAWEKKGELACICKFLMRNDLVKKWLYYDFPLGPIFTPQNKAYAVGFERARAYLKRKYKNSIVPKISGLE